MTDTLTVRDQKSAAWLMAADCHLVACRALPPRLGHGGPASVPVVFEFENSAEVRAKLDAWRHGTDAETANVSVRRFARCEDAAYGYARQARLRQEVTSPHEYRSNQEATSA